MTDGMKKFLLGVGIAVLIGLAVFVIQTKPARAQIPQTVLGWTAPGDDGAGGGRASQYEIRLSKTAIAGTDTLGWWNAATAVAGLPLPGNPGTADSVSISLSTWNTTYYFIIRTADDGLPGSGVPNWSGFSNVASKSFGPPPDMTPPRMIFDLFTR